MDQSFGPAANPGGGFRGDVGADALAIGCGGAALATARGAETVPAAMTDEG
jgi:hypothetical protein